MAFNLNTFKSAALTQGGYRPSLFDIEISRAGSRLRLLAQAAQVPSYTVGSIEVPYFGRKIKLAGDRTYAEWTTTIMIDETFETRRQLERWQMDINSAETNLRAQIGNAYKEDARVRLYGKAGNVIRTYRLIGCWPSDIAPIELDWNTTDTVAIYTVTWQFDYLDAGR